ncbi:MAG: diguanylate cyclase [Pseudomonadota bacterium]
MPVGSEPSGKPPFSTALNALAIGFMIALALTGAIAGTAHVLTGRVIEKQSSNARVINVSGRQRMLSQRISLLSSRWVDQRHSADWQRLQDAVAMFEASHADLTAGRIDGKPHELPPSVRDIYFGEPYWLDQQVNAFLADARRVLDDGPESAAAAARMSELASPSPFHASALLGGLNAVVTAFQVEHDQQIAKLKDLQTKALMVMALALAVGASLVFFPLMRRVNDVARSLNDDALTDPLTGVNNRRGFNLRAETLVAQRDDGAVLALDIDEFKRINDKYGHAVGDAAIRHLARVASALVREGDVFGRVGGDEFAAVLSGISAADAVGFVERLRQAVEVSVCSIEGLGHREKWVSFTISVGIRTFSEPAALITLMRDADAALYDAKRSGRNCVRSSERSKTIPFPLRGA